MKIIRSGIFETNSSSTHSCIIDNTYNMNKFMNNEYYYIGNIEYGLFDEIEDYIQNNLTVINKKFIDEDEAIKLVEYIKSNNDIPKDTEKEDEDYNDDTYEYSSHNLGIFLEYYCIYNYDTYKELNDYLAIDVSNELVDGVDVTVLCTYGHN